MGRTGLRLKRVSRAEHHAARLDSIEALPDHGDDRARSHVLDQTREERPILQVFVVCAKIKKEMRGLCDHIWIGGGDDGTHASGGARA